MQTSASRCSRLRELERPEPKSERGRAENLGRTVLRTAFEELLKPMLWRILFATLTNSIRQISPNFDLKLWKVRSRLYRRRFLQSNTRWKALDEIYKFHNPLVTYNFKNFENFEKFAENLTKNSSKIDELIRQFVNLGDELLFASILASSSS